MLRIFLILRHQARTIPARAVIFFYLFNSLYLWKRNAYEQLQFYLVNKNCNSQITNENEKNETEEKKEMQYFHS